MGFPSQDLLPLISHKPREIDIFVFIFSFPFETFLSLLWAFSNASDFTMVSPPVDPLPLHPHPKKTKKKKTKEPYSWVWKKIIWLAYGLRKFAS